MSADDDDIPPANTLILASLEPLPPNADLVGVRPDKMTRLQLARALEEAATGSPPVHHVLALLAAAAIRLREKTYKDGVLAERCVLCLQRTYGELDG